MAKVYIYRLRFDAGGAPCVSDGILSLSICKPAIRSTAQRGNIVLDFAANSLYSGNCLIYLAKITNHLDGRDYFSKSNYAARPDCVYLWDGRHFEWKGGSKFHSQSDLEHDLGKAPHYERANVLLRSNFPIRYERRYQHIKRLVEELGRGHRVNHGPEVQQEFGKFIKELFRVPSVYRETAVPKDWCSKKCCGGDEGLLQLSAHAKS